MTTAFDRAISALFADPNLARNATYIPLSGPNKSVRIIMRAPDLYQNVGSSVIETPTVTLEVQVADCPALVVGDVFLIDKVKYIVHGEPRRDAEQLTWQVDVYDAA